LSFQVRADPWAVERRHRTAATLPNDIPRWANCAEKNSTLCTARKKCGTRKIKGRAKTGPLQDEFPRWAHRGRGEINAGKHDR